MADRYKVKNILTELGDGKRGQNVVLYGEDAQGNPVPVKVDKDGYILTKPVDSNTVIYGPSSEDKPTEGVEIGDVYYEVDTTNAFMYGGESLGWREM